MSNLEAELLSSPTVPEKQVLTDEKLKAELIGTIESFYPEMRGSRKVGELPKPAIVSLPTYEVDSNMPLEERLRVINQMNGIFEEVSDHIHEKQMAALPLLISLGLPESHEAGVVDWKRSDGQSVKTRYIRIATGLATMENFLLDKDGEPIASQPELWIGKGLIQDFLREHQAQVAA